MHDDPNAVLTRKRLLAALPGYFEVLDSGRGVVVIIPASAAESELAKSYFTAVAASVKSCRGLHLNVESHGQTERESLLVMDGLIRAGISPDIVVFNSYGNTRPRVSNAAANARAQNRRVEIVISGDPIGTLATWDQRYALRPQ